MRLKNLNLNADSLAVYTVISCYDLSNSLNVSIYMLWFGRVIIWNPRCQATGNQVVYINSKNASDTVKHIFAGCRSFAFPMRYRTCSNPKPIC